MTRNRTAGGRAAPGGARLWRQVALLLAVLGLLGLAPGRAEAAPCSPTQEDCDANPGGGGDDGGGGGGGGGGGTAFTTPVVYVSARADTSLMVNWIVSDAATSYRVEHDDGGGWAAIYQSSQPGQGDDASFQHGPLPRDTRHCYRVVARRGGVTKTSTTACAFTKDGLLLRTLWRVQLRITTGDVPNGDTDDDVRATIHGPISGHTGGSTWLDHAGDDFERGATRNYDLVNLTGIAELGDIEGIQLYKPGSDDWCVQNVTLLVNDAPVFSTGLGPPCQVVNGGATELLQIPHDTLHDYPLWGKRTETSGPLAGYRIPIETLLNGNYATLVISHDQLEGRIESQVGDAMVDSDAYWAPPDAVELTRWDSRRANVDLDLRGSVTGPNADIDVDFDMVAGTHRDSSGKWFVDVRVENARASVDVAWYQTALGALIGVSASGAESDIESTLDGIAESVGIAQIHDVQASFDNGGNLVILATLQCPNGEGPVPTIPRECMAGNAP